MWIHVIPCSEEDTHSMIWYVLTHVFCKLWKLVRRWHISFRGLQSIELWIPLKFDNRDHTDNNVISVLEVYSDVNSVELFNAKVVASVIEQTVKTSKIVFLISLLLQLLFCLCDTHSNYSTSEIMHMNNKTWIMRREISENRWMERKYVNSQSTEGRCLQFRRLPFCKCIIVIGLAFTGVGIKKKHEIAVKNYILFNF